MIEQVKITKVFTSDKKKDGAEFKTKAGKKFWKVAIKTDKYPDNWYTAFAFDQGDEVMGLKEGDEVKVVLWKDGDWYNFKLPTRLDELEERVQVLETFMRSTAVNKEMAKPSTPEIQISSDDIPF